MATNINIAYGCLDGELVHVSRVERGLKCNCSCPSCGNALIARKGPKKADHFAHTPGTDCSGAAESALHILAKQIISNLPSISVPEYTYKRTKSFRNGIFIAHEQLLAKGGSVQIETVKTEVHHGSYKPDIEIFTQGKRLVVEVAVTHKVEKKKLRLFRKHDVPAIEIRFLEEHALLNVEELRELIQSDNGIKHWLYHPKEKEANALFYEKYRAVKSRFGKGTNRTTIRPLRKTSGAPQKPGFFQAKKSKGWQIYEEIGEQFFRKHGRYPSLEEAAMLWPRLFNPNKKF